MLPNLMAMVNYDLHRLGWHAFQQLCLTICREILGQTVSSYLDSNDAGKDGAFSGTWKQHGQEDLRGQFVIQCKFTEKESKRLSLGNLRDEMEKAEKLVSEGRCDSYVLITNAGVSGAFEGKVIKALKAIGVKYPKVYGTTWICEKIRESGKLRLLVPRLYGLGDLSQILDERAYSQAKLILTSMREDLAKIVMTSTYHNAAKAMDDHGYVLIIGEPAAGKTTIASMLAMAAIDQWQLNPIKIDRPEQIEKHWNPEDNKQFFWIDDAFGITQYESTLVSGWNRILPQIKTMLKQGVKIVMTSRDYIYTKARKELKEGAFPLFNESKVVIDLKELELYERQQILYNHLKLGRQSRQFLTKIKPFLPAISEHKRFIPETARRLAEPAFTKDLLLTQYHLLDFVSRQEGFLIETINGLDIDSRAALALIYMNNGFLPSPITPSDSHIAAITRLGSDLGKSIAAMESLRDSLIQFVPLDDSQGWRFKHPTIGDAYSKILSASPELLQIFLEGAALEEVMYQVTCGNMQLENAVIIPKELFVDFARWLSEFNFSKRYKNQFSSIWNAEYQTYNFLARRCSKSFLEIFVENNKQILENIVKPTMTFSYNHKVNLVVRLHKEGLLPEEYRRSFVEYVGHFTSLGQDTTLLDDDAIRSVFSEEEFSTVKENVRSKLIPKIGSLVEKEISEFRRHRNDTAEEHMEGLIERLLVLTETFKEEPFVTRLIGLQIEKTKQWIDQNGEDDHDVPDRKIDAGESGDDFVIERSIFDDIDC